MQSAVVDDPSTGFLVVGVREVGAGSGTPLDQDLVRELLELANERGDHGDAGLAALALAGNPYLFDVHLFSPGPG